MGINIWAAVSDHLIVSLVPWILAVIIGGGLGYLIMLVIRAWAKRSPGILRSLTIFPWRSIAAWITLIVITSPLIQMRYGLGQKSGLFSLGIIMIIWAIPFTAQAISRLWFEPVIWARVVSSARMLAMASIVIAAITYHGAGFLIYRGNQEVRFDLAYQGYALTGFILLGMDLILGLPQFGISRMKCKDTFQPKF